MLAQGPRDPGEAPQHLVWVGVKAFPGRSPALHGLGYLITSVSISISTARAAWCSPTQDMVMSREAVLGRLSILERARENISFCSSVPKFEIIVSLARQTRLG